METLDIETIPPQLKDAGFTIHRGWNESLASQLVAHSDEPAIKHFTPKDHSERFRDETSAHEWHKRSERIVYSLSRAAELAGVIWFRKSPKEELEADYTFAIRLYDSARGKQLSAPFMQACEDDFQTRYNPRGIWLETDLGNTAARNLYQKMAYETMRIANERVIMVKH